MWTICKQPEGFEFIGGQKCWDSTPKYFLEIQARLLFFMFASDANEYTAQIDLENSSFLSLSSWEKLESPD